MATSIVNASAYANLIDAINMAANGVLHIPYGTWKVSRPIVGDLLPSNITIQGIGEHSVLTPDYTTYDWAGTVGASMFQTISGRNVTFESLTLDGGSDPRASDFIGFFAYNAEDIKLLGLKVTRTNYQGICIQGSRRVLIDAPKIIDCGTDVDIPNNDSHGDGIYVGQIWDGNGTISEHVYIRDAYIRSSDRLGRVGLVFEGAKHCTFHNGFIQGYDREVHWELSNTLYVKMTDSTIVHKPSEMGNAFAWNYSYKSPAAIFSQAGSAGNIMRGNTFLGETGSGSSGYVFSPNGSSLPSIFTNNIRSSALAWHLNAAVDATNGVL